MIRVTNPGTSVRRPSESQKARTERRAAMRKAMPLVTNKDRPETWVGKERYVYELADRTTDSP